MKSKRSDHLLLLWKWLFLVIGIWIGWKQLWVAVEAIFVARNDEPVSFWIWMLTGPLAILPLSILAAEKPKVGGLWLITCAIVSYFAAAFSIVAIKPEEVLQGASYIFVHYSLPMLVLGVAAFLVWKWRRDRQTAPRTGETDVH